MRVLRELVADTKSIARAFSSGSPSAREILVTASGDGSQALLLSRLRQAMRRHKIPLVGGVLRRAQTTFFGMEIGRDVHLGEGVTFLHTVGIVIGGDSFIGDRVLFLGHNTIGSVNNSGYPRIGNDVVIGAGARILGAVTIGDGASIGANAVVLCDVPAGCVAVGIPAVVRARRQNGQSAPASENRASVRENLPESGIRGMAVPPRAAGMR
jgi:serine O-acetyltransferase